MDKQDMETERKLDIIWAPWRMAYISKNGKGETSVPPREFLPGADPECFICQGAVCDPSQDRSRYILERTARTITLFNRYPYNNGHLLVAPKRHIGRLDLLDREERLELQDAITRWTGILEKTMNAEGFNVGLNLGRVAGAGLPGHLHWHIIPRWNGDTNFTTTAGSLKVIPQSMDALWDVLKDYIAKNPQ